MRLKRKPLPHPSPDSENDSCRTRRSAHLVHARSCPTASGPFRRRNADRFARAGHASTPAHQGLLALPDYETCRALVRCRPPCCRAISHRPLVPIRASGQEAVPERQLPDVERGAEVRQAIGQARTVRAAATRPAPLLALQPLEHRTAFRALALLAAFRGRSTGLHACSELAHSAHDLSSAPSEFRPGSQR